MNLIMNISQISEAYGTSLASDKRGFYDSFCETQGTSAILIVIPMTGDPRTKYILR